MGLPLILKQIHSPKRNDKNIFEKGVEFLRDNMYNKCVTKSEVIKCRQKQDGQKQRTPKISDLAFVLMQKQKSGCKSIAKPMQSHGLRQYGGGYTFFCAKNKRTAQRCIVCRPSRYAVQTTHKQRLVKGKSILPFFRPLCKWELQRRLVFIVGVQYKLDSKEGK